MGCGPETRTPKARTQWSLPMVKEMPSTTSFIRYCFFWLFLIGLCPAGVQAQETCQDLSRAIYARMNNLTGHQPESLTSILVEIKEARACFGDRPIVDVSWLLLQQAEVLQALQRFEEAQSVIDLLFNQHFETASENYRAKFYMQRFHLAMAMGAHQTARRAYTEGLLYRRHLPVHQQALYELNGAVLAIDTEEYHESAVLAEVAYALVQEPQNPEEAYARARATQVKAEALFRAGDHLEEATHLFQTAIQEFERTGRRSQIAATYVMLGRCFTVAGDTTQGLKAMEKGLHLARSESNRRSEILALHRLGQTHNERQDPQTALDYLDQALAVSDATGMREFIGDLHLARGRAFTQLDALDPAQEAYKAALAFAADAREEIQLRADAQQGLTELHGIRLESRSRWFAAFLLLSLILGAGAGYGFSRRRPPDPQPAPAVPEADPLSDRDLALLLHIEALCFDAAAHREVLDAFDTALYAQLTGSDQKALQSVKLLSLALAALDGFQGRAPYETYRKHLTRLRIALAWRVGAPRGIYGWRLWFMEQGQHTA